MGSSRHANRHGDMRILESPGDVTFQRQSRRDTEATDGRAAGLSSAEAASRLQRCGLNVVQRHGKLPLALAFLLRFRNPLIVLLIASSVVLGWTGDWTSTVIIIVMVVASVTLDF